ncbi:MAG: histidine--tRNA ligase [Anaerolineaceae bacterium]|nr:histidine--tRNA ligase [Anaerolineaceae bacterium]
MKKIIPALKGTRDFYPEDKFKHNWLLDQIRNVSESFGYQEYEAPYLEKLELYAAKSGEELVKKQAFVFTDKGGEEITLRPELTPSLARMVAQQQEELAYPLRWWAFGPIWRYERPGKGRSREFFQWNIDMIGVDSPEADAELIAVAANLFKDLGLKPEQVKIRLNDRQLMYQKLQEIGVEVTRTADVLHLIDRRDKLSSEAWVQYALEQGFLNTIISRLDALLNNYDLWEDSPRLVRCMQALERIGVREFIQYDPKVIRGLDYYTGVVFEAFDVDGGRAILGGGHYGNLVADVGGDSLPGVGFAMGDVMFPIVLEKYGLLPTQIPAPAEVLVTVFDEETLLESIELAESLRGSGLRVICYPESVKLPKQLKFADKLGIRLAVILGPDEVKTGKAVLKDMKTTEQVSVAIAELDQEIHRLLA